MKKEFSAFRTIVELILTDEYAGNTKLRERKVEAEQSGKACCADQQLDLSNQLLTDGPSTMVTNFVVVEGSSMVSDVVIGKGRLSGKGVYAARDFKEGELVVPYNLRELTQEEFDALPDGEWEWTHTFHGKIYHFPEPERYVNHDDNPNTYPTPNIGNVALRPIKKGEPITIDDQIELQRELDTFLEAYEKAANSRDFSNVAPFIADDATFWFTNGHFNGKQAIKQAFEDTWHNIKNEKYTLTEINWTAKNYWISACTYTFTSNGLINGQHQTYKGHGTNIITRIDGRWRITHEHLST